MRVARSIVPADPDTTVDGSVVGAAATSSPVYDTTPRRRWRPAPPARVVPALPSTPGSAAPSLPRVSQRRSLASARQRWLSTRASASRPTLLNTPSARSTSTSSASSCATRAIGRGVASRSSTSSPNRTPSSGTSNS
ncbi:MAG: hypothetical protein R2939_07705 [Kofleriaceae bacterium]